MQSRQTTIKEKKEDFVDYEKIFDIKSSETQLLRYCCNTTKKKKPY